MTVSTARFSRFADVRQIPPRFAGHWQNHPPRAGRVLPNLGKPKAFLPNIGKIAFALVFWAFGAFSAMAEDAAAPAAPAAAETPAPPPEAVRAPRFLAELAEHLYRWYLDEDDLDDDRVSGGVFRFLVRRIDRASDEGDKSEWAELRLPQMNVGVTVKRPDYRIEELGLDIQSDRFRIVNVFRLDETGADDAGDGWTTVDLPLEKMLSDLLDTFDDTVFPSPGLSERLHRACRLAMHLDPDAREAGDQVMHIAPMSPVANVVWVFIENENLLMRFSADDDLEDRSLWPYQELDVKTFDVFRHSLVTHDQMPGSNIYVTRDQVGRALFNCIVLGKRLIVINPDDPDAPALHRSHVHRHTRERPPGR